MILVVTGGRDYTDYAHLHRVLDALHEENPIELLVTGCSPKGGADAMAERWARHNEIDYWGKPAKFRTGTHGKSEGPMRNRFMLRDVQWWQARHESEAEVVAFPGGRGTTDCVMAARAIPMPVQPCCAAHPLPEVTR